MPGPTALGRDGPGALASQGGVQLSRHRAVFSSGVTRSTTPLHRMLTPMHSRMNDDRRRKTAVPVSPSEAMTRDAERKHRNTVSATMVTATRSAMNDPIGAMPRLGARAPSVMAIEMEPGPTVNGKVSG